MAAEHFGARIVGVTISAEQKAFIEERIADRGLTDRVEVLRRAVRPGGRVPGQQMSWPGPSWLGWFEDNRERPADLVGEEVVRVWRLYLVGGSMAFRDGRMGVDQILMVRPDGPHTLPWRRTW
jgi:cyclopropane-fatty-acyl-phospholipid synthase